MKFRVWEKDYKRWNCGDYVIFHDGTLINFDPMTGWYSGVDLDKLVVQECTDFKDQEGRVIYEGDILKSLSGDISVVKWATAYSGPQWCLFDKKGNLSDFYGGLCMTEYCIIIGNILENPELLGI